MINKKYQILIVDVYNMMFHATYGSENQQIVKKSNEEYHLEGIIMFFRMMDSYIKNYAENNDELIIYWLFDNAKSSIQKYRKSLDDNYKKARAEQPDWFYKSLDHLELILHFYHDNSFIYRQKFLEADDYVSYIINYAQNRDKNVLLVSGDQDWFRGLNSNVDQLYLQDKSIYDIEKFEQIFHYSPTYSNICFHKCFYGDKSDNIIGAIPTLPVQMFLKIIEQFTTMDQLLFNLNSITYFDLGWKAKFKKEMSTLQLNWNLVTVVELGEIDLKSNEIKCLYKEDKLRIIYESLNLLGFIDKRITSVESSVDLLDSMLDGIQKQRG
jgi:hypothetical protein